MYGYQIFKFLVNYFLFKYNDKIYFLECAHTYKHTKGYFPGVATIGNKIVYIENREIF